MNRRLLERQLKKCGLSADEAPNDLNAWQAFLDRILLTYSQYDKDRYLLERSLEISSVEMEEKMKKNKEMSLQLIQANKLASIGILASGVAHELNNPLAGIRGYAEALEYDDNMPTDAKSTLNRIIHLSDRMAKIIQQLLKLSRKNTANENETCNLKVPIQETLDLMQKEFEYNYIKVKVQYKTQELNVYGDSHRLTGVLQNLLTNSRDAFLSKQDHSNAEVNITLKKSDVMPNGVCILFSDDAGGIDEKIINQIFDPFFTTKEVGVGTGLGLALVRNSLEEISAKISVKVNKPYTTFQIDLPCAQNSDANIVSIKHANISIIAKHSSAQRPKVLLVDDEPDICEIFSRVYKNEFDIQFVSDPVTALQIIVNKTFDLVITDLKMPTLSGSTIVEEVLKKQPNCKVAIMSGHLDIKSNEKIAHRDSVLLISKPLPPKAELLKILTEYLSTPQKKAN